MLETMIKISRSQDIFFHKLYKHSQRYITCSLNHVRAMSSIPESKTPSSSSSVAIIGGGIAGLSAAQSLLLQNGVQSVTVFDMGTRNPGGRACSRVNINIPPIVGDHHAKKVSFDHGLQFLAPKSNEFKQQIKEWHQHGVVMPWNRPDAFSFYDINTHTYSCLSDLKGNDQVDEFIVSKIPLMSGIHRVLLANGIILPPPSSSSLSGYSQEEEWEPVFVGVPHNGSIAIHMADTINASSKGNVVSGCKVTQAIWDSTSQSWSLQGSLSNTNETNVHLGSFQALITSDVLTMLPDSAGYAGFQNKECVGDDVAAIASAIEKNSHHEAVFSLMISISAAKRDTNLPQNHAMMDFNALYVYNSQNNAVGTIHDGENHPFQWISRENSKPGREEDPSLSKDAHIQSFVAISTTQKAKDIMKRWPLHTSQGKYNPQTKEYRKGVAQELTADFLKVMNGALAASRKNTNAPHTLLFEEDDVVYAHAQRWGRAFVKPSSSSSPEAIQNKSKESRFIACGDYCSNANHHGAEDAWLSGKRAAEEVMKWLV